MTSLYRNKTAGAVCLPLPDAVMLRFSLTRQVIGHEHNPSQRLTVFTSSQQLSPWQESGKHSEKYGKYAIVRDAFPVSPLTPVCLPVPENITNIIVAFNSAAKQPNSTELWIFFYELLVRIQINAHHKTTERSLDV